MSKTNRSSEHAHVRPDAASTDTSDDQSGPTTSSIALETRIELPISGMTCPHCPPKVEKALRDTPGVRSAQVNLANRTVRPTYDPTGAKAGDLIMAIIPLGMSLGMYFVITYVLCVLFGLSVSSQGMHQLLHIAAAGLHLDHVGQASCSASPGCLPMAGMSLWFSLQFAVSSPRAAGNKQRCWR